MRTILSDPDRTNDFRLLGPELYLAATDLDTCERIVLGGEGWDDVPISVAVSASSALPMIYKPVRIKDRELVDGGVLSTTNLDIAVEAGAKFIVVVNPLVPYVNDFEKRVTTLTGSRVRRVSDMGFPQIGYQTFKLLAYQRLHELASRWEERYPGVDIILIEPEPNDELMFQTSAMNYTSRRRRRPARLPVGHAEARQRLPALQADLRAPRDRDLRDPRAQGRQALRGRAREDSRLAQDPRADDVDAAAPVGAGLRRCGAAANELGGAPELSPTCRGSCGACRSEVLENSWRLDRKRVLSILPLKIGTPISTHLVITSRRSSPDFARELAGRQVIGHRSLPPWTFTT